MTFPRCATATTEGEPVQVSRAAMAAYRKAHPEGAAMVRGSVGRAWLRIDGTTVRVQFGPTAGPSWSFNVADLSPVAEQVALPEVA